MRGRLEGCMGNDGFWGAEAKRSVGGGALGVSFGD